MRTFEGSTTTATSEKLRAFEERFGVVLPEAYKQFLLAHNGGRPEFDLFDVPDCPASPDSRIHFFFGVDDSSECYDLAWNVEVFSDRLPPQHTAIATSEGADMVVLSPTGEILFWDGYEHRLIPVAPSFEAFLGQLRRDEDSPDSEAG